MKHIKQLKYLTLCLAGFTTAAWAQEGKQDNTTEYRAEVFASAGSGDNTPFWIVSNQYGVVPMNANNGYARAGVFHQQHFGKGFRWNAGLDLVGSAPRHKNFYIQQLYASIGYRCLELTIGSKENYESLLDRKMSTGDLMYSANARPMPEFNLQIPEFTVVPLTKGWLQVKGNFSVGRTFDNGYLEHFTQNKQTFVKDVLWHRKSLYFQIKDTRNGFPLSAYIGIQHNAQWGGTSTNPNIGEQPHSLKDFVRIVLGKEGGDDATISDQINVLGNHIIGYNFGLAYEQENWKLKGYHHRIAEDRSGIELYNGFDGLWGLQLELPKVSWLNQVIFEYFTTMNQSGTFHFISFDHDKHPGRGGGADNYYNNGEYVAGMSYFNRGVGSPLIPAPEYNTNHRLGFQNTRVRDWHIGAAGNISSNLSYRVFCTIMHGYGQSYSPFLKRKEGVSLMADIQYTHPKLKGWKFGGTLAADTGDIFGESSTGFSVKVSKSGIIKKWK